MRPGTTVFDALMAGRQWDAESPRRLSARGWGGNLRIRSVTNALPFGGSARGGTPLAWPFAYFSSTRKVGFNKPGTFHFILRLYG